MAALCATASARCARLRRRFAARRLHRRLHDRRRLACGGRRTAIVFAHSRAADRTRPRPPPDAAARVSQSAAASASSSACGAHEPDGAGPAGGARQERGLGVAVRCGPRGHRSRFGASGRERRHDRRDRHRRRSDRARHRGEEPVTSRPAQPARRRPRQRRPRDLRRRARGRFRDERRRHRRLRRRREADDRQGGRGRRLAHRRGRGGGDRVRRRPRRADHQPQLRRHVDHGDREERDGLRGRTRRPRRRRRRQRAPRSGNPIFYPAALLQPLGSKGVGGSGPRRRRLDRLRRHVRRSPNTGSYVSLAAPGDGVFSAVSSTVAAVGLPARPAAGLGARPVRLRERNVVRGARGRRRSRARHGGEPAARRRRTSRAC